MYTNYNEKLGLYLSQSLSLISFNEVANLIKAGADPDMRNKDGDTFLHMIIKSKFFHLIPKVLALRINVNTVDARGYSALRCLFDSEPFNFDTAFSLIDIGADEQATDYKGNNILHYAAKNGDLNNLYWALKLRVNPNHKNMEGKTPLMYLFEYNPDFFDAIGLLVLSGGIAKHSMFKETIFIRDHLLDFDKATCKPVALVNHSAIKYLVSFENSKEKVLNYIARLPMNVQKIVVKLSLDKDSLLGKFFSQKRGFYNTNINTGTLKILSEWNEKLDKMIQEEMPKPSAPIQVAKKTYVAPAVIPFPLEERYPVYPPPTPGFFPNIPLQPVPNPLEKHYSLQSSWVNAPDLA